MRFIQQFGYTVKVGQEEAQQKWLIENDAALRAAAPAGTKYLGTFAVVVSSEKHAGSYIAMFELDSYAALDTSAAAMKDANSDFGRLIRDSTQFQDFDHQAPWSSSLLKNVIDASVFDPKQ